MNLFVDIVFLIFRCRSFWSWFPSIHFHLQCCFPICTCRSAVTWVVDVTQKIQNLLLNWTSSFWFGFFFLCFFIVAHTWHSWGRRTLALARSYNNNKSLAQKENFAFLFFLCKMCLTFTEKIGSGCWIYSGGRLGSMFAVDFKNSSTFPRWLSCLKSIS